MKRFVLLASVSLGATIWATQPAHALFGVGDIVSDPGSYVLQQLGLTNQAAELAKWVQQLQAMQQQYQILMQQYQSVAHLPQSIMSMGGSLTTPSFQNPLPQVGQLQGILNGSSFGSLNTLGSTFSSANTVFNPTGTDYGATTMVNRRNGWAGIQALAVNNIQSLQQQTAALGTFLSEIGKSPDVQQSAAIQARLQLEQNYAARQQAAATNLATLASAQAGVNQQQDAEAARKSAESWENATASAWGNMP